MHNRLLLTLAAPADAGPEQVRRDVFDQLMNDDSFCGGGGRFGSPLCDWFVIGGRWSGLLAETVMGGAFNDKVRALADMNQKWLSKSVIDKHAAELDAIWQSLGGTGPSPYSRSGYEELGYADDAMLLSKGLYAALLAEHEGEITGDRYADLDGEELHPDFVGRKWLVVVDYHN